MRKRAEVRDARAPPRALADTHEVLLFCICIAFKLQLRQVQKPAMLRLRAAGPGWRAVVKGGGLRTTGAAPMPKAWARSGGAGRSRAQRVCGQREAAGEGRAVVDH